MMIRVPFSVGELREVARALELISALDDEADVNMDKQAVVAKASARAKVEKALWTFSRSSRPA